MPAVNFALVFESNELRRLALPIEVRTRDSAIVKHTVASRSVELPSGRYYATARLPGGQRLLEPFEVHDAPLTVRLTPDPDDRSPHEWEEMSYYFRPPVAARRRESTRRALASDAALMVAAPGFRAQFRVFSGNPVHEPLQIERALDFVTLENFEQGRIVQFRVRGDVPLVAQLLQPGEVALNMVVPASPGVEARIIFARERDHCSMEPHLGNDTADLMLRFTGTAAITDGDEIIQSTLLDAERLIDEENGDPIAAAVAAYATLRFQSVTRLGGWTHNLCSRFPWLADGAAIYGEHLARVGKHVEAETWFSKLPARGLPIVADGLLYTVERLKLYSSLDAERSQGVDVGRAARTLKDLERFVPFVDRERPILSFSGLRPSAPDASVVTGIPGDSHALDLSRWLGEAQTPLEQQTTTTERSR